MPQLCKKPVIQKLIAAWLLMVFGHTMLSELRAELLTKGKSFRNLTLYIEANRTFQQDHPFTAFNTETATSGYTLINAGISTNVASKGKTLFSLYLLGNNLGDVAYQNHLSRLKYTDVNDATGRMGVFNLGRNFMFKLNIPLSFNTYSKMAE